MKQFIITLALATMFVGSSFAEEWEIDQAHSNIGFAVKHMMVSTVHGSFGKYSGKVDFNPAKPEASVFEATIEAASINTNVDARDKHLRSPDFFDVEKFPNITFKSKSVKSLGGNKYSVTGDLTIHGVTKTVVLEGEGFAATYKSPWGKTVTAASATATINRKDFGLTWNKALETGGVIVDEDVKIVLELELMKK